MGNLNLRVGALFGCCCNIFVSKSCEALCACVSESVKNTAQKCYNCIIIITTPYLKTTITFLDSVDCVCQTHKPFVHSPFVVYVCFPPIQTQQDKHNFYLFLHLAHTHTYVQFLYQPNGAPIFMNSISIILVMVKCLLVWTGCALLHCDRNNTEAGNTSSSSQAAAFLQAKDMRT